MRAWLGRARSGICWLLWGLSVSAFMMIFANWLMTLDLDYLPTESDPCVQELRRLKAEGRLSLDAARTMCPDAEWLRVESSAPEAPYHILTLYWGSDGGLMVVFDGQGSYLSSDFGEFSALSLAEGTHPADAAALFIFGGGFALVLLLLAKEWEFYLARNAALWTLGIWGVGLASILPTDPLNPQWLPSKLTLSSLPVMLGIGAVWDFARALRQRHAQI